MNFPWNTRQPSDKWAASIEDIRQQIGHQIDRLAKLASEAGRDVYGQAAQISTDTGAQVGAAARDLGDQAARAGQGAKSQAAVTASTLAQQAMRGAAQLGRDIRSVRITREPPRRSPDFMPGITLLAGVGTGLAIMYFFDPGEGRRPSRPAQENDHRSRLSGGQVWSTRSDDLLPDPPGAALPVSQDRCEGVVVRLALQTISVGTGCSFRSSTRALASA